MTNISLGAQMFLGRDPHQWLAPWFQPSIFVKEAPGKRPGGARERPRALGSAREAPGRRPGTRGSARETPGRRPAAPGSAREAPGSARERPGAPGRRPGTPGSARERPGGARERPGTCFIDNQMVGATSAAPGAELTSVRHLGFRVFSSREDRRQRSSCPYVADAHRGA